MSNRLLPRGRPDVCPGVGARDDGVVHRQLAGQEPRAGLARVRTIFLPLPLALALLALAPREMPGSVTWHKSLLYSSFLVALTPGKVLTTATRPKRGVCARGVGQKRRRPGCYKAYHRTEGMYRFVQMYQQNLFLHHGFSRKGTPKRGGEDNSNQYISKGAMRLWVVLES